MNYIYYLCLIILFGLVTIDVRADNSPDSAQNLGLLRGHNTIYNQVGPTDINDYYLLELDEEKEVDLILDKLNSNASLGLYQVKGRVLIESSLRGGRSPERIIRKLPPGPYLVRVASYRAPISGFGKTKYRLRILTRERD